MSSTLRRGLPLFRLVMSKEYFRKISFVNPHVLRLKLNCQLLVSVTKGGYKSDAVHYSIAFLPILAGILEVFRIAETFSFSAK